MSDDAAEVLVFDTGPLSHFALSGWLGVLKAVVGDRRALVPDAVVSEVRRGVARDGRLRPILDCGWIEQHDLSTAAELTAFATFSELLVRGDRNRGEAAVLALASTVDGVAVIDDGAGRKAARRHGLPLRPTLALLCDAIRIDLLTVPLVSALADDLLASSYRLPFGPGGFEKWYPDNGAL